MSSTRGIGLPRNPDWRDQADCRRPGVDPEWWFPKGTTGPDAIQADDAKAFCRECPVAVACARWAITQRVTDGIYGGLTELQRRRIGRLADEKHLTSQQITDQITATWERDARDPLVEAYLRNSIQGDDGHVWWRQQATSYTLGGRCYTPAQLAFTIGNQRAPEGHVKATCGQPYCVAAEHLADSRMRAAIKQRTAA